ARAILERYYVTRGGLTDARLRMARVPAGADLIENRMSGAPGIRHGNIFIMAGVPHITAGMLDSLTRWELQEVLMEVWARTKVTAVCVTHDVDEALLLADRVVMMTNGPNARIG
ncbi:hypothetical protein ABTO68_18650, partial [Acinetobacter baumannii]